MKKYIVWDLINGRDITPFVSLRVGEGGWIHVFNSMGVDITENVEFRMI